MRTDEQGEGEGVMRVSQETQNECGPRLEERRSFDDVNIVMRRPMSRRVASPEEDCSETFLSSNGNVEGRRSDERGTDEGVSEVREVSEGSRDLGRAASDGCG